MKISSFLFLSIFLVLVVFSESHDRDFLLPRPPIYSGIMTKTEFTLRFGFAYHEHLHERKGRFLMIREVCSYDDRVDFRSTEGDGLNFGVTSIQDDWFMDVTITEEWVKPETSNGSVALRITGVSNNKDEEAYVSVYTYVSISGDQSTQTLTCDSKTISGHSNDYGDFELVVKSQNQEPIALSYLGLNSSHPYEVSSTISENMGRYKHAWQLPNKTLGAVSDTNVGIIEKVFQTPFTLTVYLQSPSDPIPESFDCDDQKEKYKDDFDQKFATKFPNVAPENTDFAKNVLNTLLNGLSYFSGERIIKYPNGTVQTFENSELFSFIPNKVYFPRPFFWDEGFHDMIIHRWDPELFKQIIKSWFNIQVSDGEWSGWIAREQVIGKEAQSRCPEWAWTGIVGTMNPPVFYITLEQFIDENPDEIAFLKEMYPKLQMTYNFYFKHCHIKSDQYSFKWPGRTYGGDFGGTLDSGLDDYPRYHLEFDTEIDIDLQAWMASCSSIMKKFASLVGDTTNEALYQSNYEKTTNILFTKNWNDEKSLYQDYIEPGLFSDHTGYLNLFTLLLKLEPIDDGKNDRVDAILDLLLKENSIVSEIGGIRSLSVEDSGFLISGNYWCGAIWINLNYLTLSGLKYYEPYYPKAKTIRQNLENILITNMKKEYEKESGGIFEIYLPYDGEGYSNLPFAGWSTLILLIMAQIY
ncbi:mannosyl-oligosaccharide glucosidase [Anaeramoeba flamelloides]|uniref:Mannosyl-oligosaccharide glucosidase n=1 Tax=Anaeramoeba flamelloides TaxID=1746091 RepID=A0ABQ8Y2L6_9EUKA|nr:mannosyl-oligosaccharide glucosidase [Anaeramoeba flamelloides]